MCLFTGGLGRAATKVRLQTILSLIQKNVLPEKKIYFITDFIKALK